MLLILRYRFVSFINKIKNLKGWKRLKTLIFSLVSFFLLILLYLSFLRILKYLKGVELIGDLLIWKLSSMVFVISFSMIVVSSLIISMTTLFYSYDLKFLFSLPVREDKIFGDKTISTVFYSSWSLVVIIMPYVLALMKVNGFGFGFLVSFVFLVVPYAFLAAVIGVIFSLLLMYFFPNSKTRDAVWILSSLSFSLVYVALRFSKPEKLLRPDMLGVIANYLSYLQAPTATYLPSWWFTKALISWSGSNYSNFLFYSFLLYGSSWLLFWLLLKLSLKTYLKAFSGSQSANQKKYFYKNPFEFKFLKFSELKDLLAFFYKERITVKRDIRYFSQIILIIALSMVYVFSVKSLPLDNYEAKNFVSFLNITVAGFVVSAISLRFVFTSISSEGGAWWIVKTAPVKIENFLFAKLIFYFIPIYLFSMVLVSVSNYYLEADLFMFRLSVFIITVMSFVISVFAVGFGSIFPDFNIENIHQVESSYGGFIFMAASVFYCVVTATIFSYPVRNYFFCLYNPNYTFEKTLLYSALLVFLIISFLSSFFIFSRAVKSLKSHES